MLLGTRVSQIAGYTLFSMNAVKNIGQKRRIRQSESKVGHKVPRYEVGYNNTLYSTFYR